MFCDPDDESLVMHNQGSAKWRKFYHTLSYLSEHLKVWSSKAIWEGVLHGQLVQGQPLHKQYPSLEMIPKEVAPQSGQKFVHRYS